MRKCELCEEVVDAYGLNGDGWCVKCEEIIAKARAKNYPEEK